MARGGSRPGAGRKKGSLTKRTQEIAAAAASNGITPLDYMLEVMRTSKDPKRRDTMAIAAAPYVHPRLSSVKTELEQEDPFKVILRSLDGITKGIPSEADQERWRREDKETGRA